MKSIKVALIDDEKRSIDYLEDRLLKLGNIEVVGKFTNPVDESEQIINTDAQALFMETQMSGISGIGLAKRLQRVKPKLHIIFVTSHRNYAVEAFEMNVLDYLVKPVTLDRLQKPIRKIVERM
ncbi:LytR/AlgR family response regulator transcription factor [Paenibacillus flagellatus]|uniref:Response regulatory domain-containing protein n=1 Tax=Paenibacillus flagellatus TaxID=2211139 RepID=A0A2V5K3N0_9BACL|nr:response regulator [Paenibacillus flagellatus]PYI53838.1 hypothetical protein DLM86_14880 [Paenibacillus flagellatus]